MSETTERPLWEQRNRPEDEPKESDEAYAAFLAYRDLVPGERSIRDVAQKLNKSLTLLGKWSKRWSWPDRCAAWDRVERARLDDAKSLTFDELRIEQRLKRQGIILSLQSMLTQVVEAATKDKAVPSPADLHRITRAAGVIMEQSRREMNDLPIQRQEFAGPNGGPIQTEGTLKPAGIDDFTGTIRDLGSALEKWKAERAAAHDARKQQAEGG